MLVFFHKVIFEALSEANRSLKDIDLNNSNVICGKQLADLVIRNPVLTEVTLDDDYEELDAILSRNAAALNLAVESTLCLIGIRKYFRNSHLFFSLPKEIVLMIAKELYATRFEPCWQKHNKRL